MKTKKDTKFPTVNVTGTRFSIEKSLSADIAVKSIDKDKKEIVIVAGDSDFARGDMIYLVNTGELDGCYPVENVAKAGATDLKLSLHNEIEWEDKIKPTDITKAKIQKIEFTNNFCAVKDFNIGGTTFNKVELESICGKQIEAGDAEYGDITLNNYFSPDSESEALLRRHARSKESFAIRFAFEKQQGYIFVVGLIMETGDLSGSAGDKFSGSYKVQLQQERLILGSK